MTTDVLCCFPTSEDMSPETLCGLAATTRRPVEARTGEVADVALCEAHARELDEEDAYVASFDRAADAAEAEGDDEAWADEIQRAARVAGAAWAEREALVRRPAGAWLGGWRDALPMAPDDLDDAEREAFAVLACERAAARWAELVAEAAGS
jgi:hypothetical protein